MPIWEGLENEALLRHFAPGERDLLKAAAITCREAGIDATYGVIPPAEALPSDEQTIVSGQTRWLRRWEFETPADLRNWRPEPFDPSAYAAQYRDSLQHHRAAFEPHTVYTDQAAGFGWVTSYGHRGLTTFLMALYDQLPALERVWDYRSELALIRNSVFAEQRCSPVTQFCEDVAFKGRLICSPALLRDHFFPRAARVIAPLKRAGIKVVWHSDGDITPIIDLALDAGFDGIDPVEPTAGMDIAAIKRRYRGRLILVGNVDTHALAFGAPADVERAVRDCICAASPGGGHILQAGAGELMPDVPLENCLAYLRAAHRHGRYPIALDPSGDTE